MKYMLLLAEDPELDPIAPPDRSADEEVFDDWVELTQALRDAGVLVAGDALHGRDTATTVRVRGGERIVSDGPFAETNEMLIGYYVIDVEDLDTACAWAARMPHVRGGSVEVRPIMTSPASA